MKMPGACILALMLISVVQAQRGAVKITIINEQQSALENATVEIVKAKDSSLVKAGITDKKGLAELENIRFGDYLVKVTMINYSTGYSAAFSLSAVQPDIFLPQIVLHPGTSQLGGVTVTARKPFIQKLSDRIVVNVENSIVSAGSS